VILGLAIVRIGWKVWNKGKPVPVVMPKLQKIAAAAGHGLLYLLILAQPISGWMMSSAANYPVTFFGLFEFPALLRPNEGARGVRRCTNSCSKRLSLPCTPWRRHQH
jgi:cytochrome b561